MYFDAYTKRPLGRYYIRLIPVPKKSGPNNIWLILCLKVLFLVSEMPNMSEPNPELAAQFEKEDAERKAARANRDGPMGPAGMSWGRFLSRAGHATIF